MEVSKLVRENLAAMKPYVPGKPIEEVERELGISNVIKLASNENPLGPSAKAVEAMMRTAAKAHIYPDGNCYYLKDELAKQFGVSADYLMVGNGSDELLKLIAETFLKPGDEVVMAQPSFSEYIFATKLMDAKCIHVPLNNFTHDLTEMAAKITKRTKLLFVCNPNNPTGTVVTKAEVEQLLAKVPEHVMVIFDEAYYEYVQDGDYPETLEYVKDGAKNVIVLRTFSKIHALAGLRVGYGLAHPEVLGWINRTREPFNVNIMAQAAAVASLQDSGHVKASVELNERGKAQLYKGFEERGMKYVPTEANFMLAKVGVSSKELFPLLLKEGVIVRTGDIFGLDEYIRLTIGKEEENERFFNALDKALGQLTG
ncbi:histidinol-phosphate transaminase [Metallumcola ferriviriculae]|uniref:Histidinol-phosphate aminotransferase n=1 Tax=Metallumcola ferriviriculae TaxID=3039180 RepID=A0AAU0UJW8_9FIRM|nr:histidinol-phosphate transaminase [Desulfitibacteraceae bacterium MK1]